jgi:hypothetical protein
MQNRDPGESFKVLTPTCGELQKHKITLFLSTACAKRNDGTHQPGTKVKFTLKIYRTSYSIPQSAQAPPKGV